jgi:hypothetical protein
MHRNVVVNSDIEPVHQERESARQLPSAERVAGARGPATQATWRMMWWAVAALMTAALVWVVGAQAHDSGASGVRHAAARTLGYGTTALPCRHMMRWGGPAPACSTTTEHWSRVSPGASAHDRVVRIVEARARPSQ